MNKHNPQNRLTNILVRLARAKHQKLQQVLCDSKLSIHGKCSQIMNAHFASKKSEKIYICVFWCDPCKNKDSCFQLPTVPPVAELMLQCVKILQNVKIYIFNKTELNIEEYAQGINV